MEKSYSESYAAAGVDITAGYRSVELMKQYVARTMNEHCIGGLGGFGGLFELDCTGYKHPVLISGTDGVGTKLKIAMIMDKHDTIGIDCVAWWSTQSPAPARGRACASCSESTPPGSAATPWWAHWDRPFFPCPWAWASW